MKARNCKKRWEKIAKIAKIVKDWKKLTVIKLQFTRKHGLLRTCKKCGAHKKYIKRTGDDLSCIPFYSAERLKNLLAFCEHIFQNVQPELNETNPFCHFYYIIFFLYKINHSLARIMEY